MQTRLIFLSNDSQKKTGSAKKNRQNVSQIFDPFNFPLRRLLPCQRPDVFFFYFTEIRQFSFFSYYNIVSRRHYFLKHVTTFIDFILRFQYVYNTPEFHTSEEKIFDKFRILFVNIWYRIIIYPFLKTCQKIKPDLHSGN